jgi:hypothetical protein
VGVYYHTNGNIFSGQWVSGYRSVLKSLAFCACCIDPVKTSCPSGGCDATCRVV